MSANEYATPVLVISCDRYADIWKPFFKMFWNFWPDCPFPVYLGSNFKIYNDHRVVALTVGEDLSWASGVLKMLDCLKSEYILLFLEDFFLKEKVDTNKILELLSIAEIKQIGCLRLVSASHLSFPPTEPIIEYPGLGVIVPGDMNRVSTQVAIWRTETLKKLLNPGFNAWQFEEIGTVLSEELPDLFWGTYKPVIIYDQCVEKGKWKPEGLNHCRNNGIEIDLTVRGCLSEQELNKNNLSVESEIMSNAVKRSMILSFKSGQRMQGLLNGVRYIFKKPLSVKFWIIIFFGLLGKKSIHWLFKQYATFKISRIEKFHDKKLNIVHK